MILFSFNGFMYKTKIRMPRNLPGVVAHTLNSSTAEAERQRGREAERQRGREAERQRGREAERQRGRERGREAERQRQRQRQRQENQKSRPFSASLERSWSSKPSWGYVIP
jgi:hypothetical protein